MLGKYQSLRKDPRRYQAVKYERSYKIFASDVAMVELSDCIGYHIPCGTPQEVLEAVEDRDGSKGLQPIVYLNIVKIGVSDCYQKLGIATAVIDCLTHMCKNYGYAYIRIECVLSERLRSLLAKRKDCVSLQNGGIGCSFLIKFE